MSYETPYEESAGLAKALAGNAVQTIAPEHGDSTEMLALATAASTHAQLAIAHAIAELAQAVRDSGDDD